MNRLTVHAYENDLFKDIYCKLVQLENIEEELGVELTTLFKALRDGVFIIGNDGRLYEEFIKSIDYWPGCWSFTSNESDIEVRIKDYGVTWALTIEELEMKEDE